MCKVFAFLAMTAFGSTAYAGDYGPLTVVELYTSEGCSSCPPADEILTKLSKNENILALALHVDYWDYLGWKDKFSMAKFTDRQRKYNMVIPSRYRLVTPQMIFHGRSQVAGAKPRQVSEHLENVQKKPEEILLTVDANDETFRVSIEPNGVTAVKADVFVVQYTPSQVSKIKAGENRGLTLTHTNVVTSWERIGEWNGQAGYTVEQPLNKDNSAAVIVQITGNGPILAARKLQ